MLEIKKRSGRVGRLMLAVKLLVRSRNCVAGQLRDVIDGVPDASHEDLLFGFAVFQRIVIPDGQGVVIQG